VYFIHAPARKKYTTTDRALPVREVVAEFADLLSGRPIRHRDRARDPVDIAGVFWKFIAEGDDLVLDEKDVECLSEARA
jgi:hypothetical protein